MNRDVCEHFNPAPCARCRRLQLANIIEQDPTTTWGYREASHAAAAELRRPIEAEQQRDELLVALRWIERRCKGLFDVELNALHKEAVHDAEACARYAVAKAEVHQPRERPETPPADGGVAVSL
jgi:hypothetical protein